jgi:hypothetical protein
MSARRRANEVDANSLKVHFSPSVREALQELEVAVHFNREFSNDVRAVLHEWVTGKPLTVHGVLVALPLIAEEVFGHIRATGDERAAEAWRTLCTQMNENGFALTRTPIVGRL